MDKNQSAAPAADVEGLTDERIQEAATEAVRAGSLSWLGFELDSDGKFTVPILSKCHFQFARAIEREVLATRPSVDLSGLTLALRKIADDFHPDRDADAPLALSEMRDALNALIENMPAPTSAAAVGEQVVVPGSWRDTLDEAANKLGAYACLCPSDQEADQIIAELRTIAAHLARQDQAGAVAVEWKPLKDSHWVNIVNHNHAYEGYSKEDAVHEAVKRTEAKLKELNATPAMGSAPQAADRPFKRGLALLCDLLPAEFMWGDGLQASTLELILDRYDALSPQADEQPSMAGAAMGGNTSLQGLESFNAHPTRVGAMVKCERGNYLRRIDVEHILAAPVAQEGEQSAQKLPNFTISRFSDTKRRGVLVIFDRKISDDELQVVRSALSTQSTPSDSGSVDTPVLRERFKYMLWDEYAELVAHLDSLIAARVAGVRKDALGEPDMLWWSDDNEVFANGPDEFANDFASNSLRNGESQLVNVDCAYRGSKRTMRITVTEVEDEDADSVVSWEWIDAAMAAHSPATLADDSVRKDAESAAARDVLAERSRQKEVEGWTPEHDDEHHTGSLAQAAAVYALVGASDGRTLGDELTPGITERLWPWSWNWFKPKSRRYNLVRAGALILAEIERIDRAHSPATSSKENA